MISNTAVSNIINQGLDNKNIYFYGKPDMFSSMLENDIEKNLLYEPSQVFSCIIADDPIQYSQIIDNISIKYHTNSIILFHNSPIKLLKKEDKRILYSKLKESYKIFFDKTIQSEWSFPHDDKTFCIDYGISAEFSRLYDNVSKKSKHIAIINFKDNKEINYLFDYFKNYFDDVDLITNADCDYKTMLKKLSCYKIAICFHDPFSTLSLAGLGCYVFSNSYIHDYKNIVYIEDVTSITQQISNIDFEQQQKNIDYSINKILETYCLNNFYTSFHKIINQAIGRPYVYST